MGKGKARFSCCASLQVHVYMSAVISHSDSEVVMGVSFTVLFSSFVLVALVAMYVPTIYIRKTNKLMKILEKIEANTRK